MGVSRSIRINILSKEKTIVDCLDLLFEQYWTPFDKNNKIVVSDEENTENIESIEGLYIFVIEKENNKLTFNINLWDIAHKETVLLLLQPKEKFENYNSFKLTLLPGAAKRLNGSNRQTDFSYYLERTIPILEKNNFIFEEISCIDLG